MKLSSFALASLIAISPNLATATPISHQTTNSQSEPIMVAQFRLPGLPIPIPIEVPNSIDTILKTFEEIYQGQKLEEERQLREINRIKQQEEREARISEARKQRQAYFDSLTPEQQQAYIEEQKRRQQQQIDMISQFFLEALVSSTSTQPDQGDYWQGMTREEYFCYIDPNCD